jgi:hypothetical protein
VEVFDKLVAFPSLMTHPHLTVECYCSARITFVAAWPSAGVIEHEIQASADLWT